MKNHAVIVLHNKDKILFIQRSSTKKSLPNKWAFPSGTIEGGESENETVVREAREELDIEVNIEGKLVEVELPEFAARLHFVVCTSNFPEKINYDSSEIQKIEWLTFDEFFSKYTDNEIGHGLIYLRKHPELLSSII